MQPYVSLHAHVATGSIGDSIIKIDDYIEKAKQLNLPAIAVTDHGSMSAVYEFYNACNDAGIKPIIGCEVYETEEQSNKTVESNTYHTLLIARSNEGYQNLLHIVTNAATDGFYSKPRTDIEILKKYGKGIIATSACVGSKINQAILREVPDAELIKMIEDYKEAFDAFFLELQPGRFLEQQIVNQKLQHLASLTNTPMIITNDIHYLNKQDAIPHDAHVKIARKKDLDTPRVYPDDIYYMMDHSELENAFEGTLPKDTIAQCVQNIHYIIDACDVTIPTKLIMPTLNDLQTPSDIEIMKRCLTELENMSDRIDINLYTERLMMELDVIRTLGFSDYFLVVEDFLKHADEKGIPRGPGRGSVAGSLVAYLLDISLPDPIKYGLLFERFLSPNRASIPDIDMDFSSDRRGEMFEYVAEKYGSDHCSLVSTVQMRKSKRAIRDIGRIFNIDKETVNKVASLIPTYIYDDDGEKETDLSIQDALAAVPALRNYQQQYPEWFEMAIRLSDIPANKSVHAAGVLLAPVKLSDSIPLVRSKNDAIMATSLTLQDAENAGFVKFDFLSLASLYVYDETLKDIGQDFDYRNDDFSDEGAWDLIGSNKTTGLFQISSHIYKSRMGKLKPRSIEELAACLALLRGPCISIKADKDYIDIIDGKRQPEYIHELYWDVTKETKGIILYQEQIMKLAVNMGFDQEESYKLMKMISKKKPELIAGFKEKFFKLGREKQIQEPAIARMWQIVEVAGAYCFNKSHAVAYAMLSYCSGYLKANYPLYFLKNLLTNACIRSKEEEIVEAVVDCRRYGIQFLPPDINKSEWAFTVEDGKVRVGLCAIKGLGGTAWDAIKEERQNGLFSNLANFVDRIPKKNCNKTSIVALILSGAFTETDQGGILDEKDIYELYMETIRKESLPEKFKCAKKELPYSAALEDIEKLYMVANFIHDPQNTMVAGEWLQTDRGDTVTTTGVVDKRSNKKDTQDNAYVVVTFASGDGMLELVGEGDVLKDHSKLLRKHKQLSLVVQKTGLNTGIIIEAEEIK